MVSGTGRQTGNGHQPTQHDYICATTISCLHPPTPRPHTHKHTQGSIDSTRVTCVKWVPGSDHQFVSSHRSGYLYIWNTGYTGKTNGVQSFILHKDITDAKICTPKPKSKSPILYRWSIGHGAVNAFAFSPDANHVAIASQDGFLRVYDFHKQEIYGRMRSYFGGLLCVCWSPDGKYAVTGGEDDLVTIWSFDQRRVVARGEGHKSYVSAVAFDPHMTTLPDGELLSPSSSIPPSRETETPDDGEPHTSSTPSSGNQTKAQPTRESPTLQSHSKFSLDSTATSQLNRYLSKSAAELAMNITAYRLGSVGQDTQLCLWDLSGDVLKPRRPFLRNRSQMSRHSRPVSMVDPPKEANDTWTTSANATTKDQSTCMSTPNGPGTNSSNVDSKEPNRTVPDSVQNADSTTVPTIGNHVDSSAKRTSISSNRDSNAEDTMLTAPEQLADTAHCEHIPLVPIVPHEEGRSSTPSTVSTSSEKGVGKKEKKHKKEKHKDKSKQGTVTPKHSSTKNGNGSNNTSAEGEKYIAKKSHRRSLSKMIKFVSNIGVGNSHGQHSHRRTVSAFETCKSDDIAPKMSEVNLIEPLVAKKITNERLTALVFHRDCIITACQEGFVQTWSRPGTELPSGATQQHSDIQNKKEPASSLPSNPGVSLIHKNMLCYMYILLQKGYCLSMVANTHPPAWYMYFG